MDLMSGFDIRLVFTLPPSDSTLQYKRCVHLVIKCLFYDNRRGLYSVHSCLSNHETNISKSLKQSKRFKDKI